MTTYYGTKITGTSTTAKVFSKSGVSAAKVNDEYVNTSTHHVYKCTVAGKPSAAKWKYDHTALVWPPEKAVKTVTAPKRGSSGADTYSTSWKVPDALKDSKNDARAAGVYVEWMLHGTKGGKSWTALKKVKISNLTTTGATANLGSFATTNGLGTLSRSSFWPQGKVKLDTIGVDVYAWNAIGEGKRAGSYTMAKLPRKPSIGAFAINSENGHVTVTVTTNAGEDNAERHDTHVLATVYDSRTKKTTKIVDTDTTSTSYTVTYDATGYASVNYPDYLRIDVQAYARGWAGDSETVAKSWYVSKPAKATIKGVKASSNTSSGLVTVTIDTNATSAHPVDGVVLEKLSDTTYAKKSDIPANTEWTATDATDDGQCRALCVPVSTVAPSAGKYSWVRVKSWHGVEAQMSTYSEPVRVKDLETPAPVYTAGAVRLESATSGADGESAVVVMGWNAETSAGEWSTELTWSTDDDAWKSTREPESYSFEWSDGARTIGSTSYSDSATISIKDLDAGERYVVKARRVGDTENGTAYGPWSNALAVTPTAKPESVVLDAPQYVIAEKWWFIGDGRYGEHLWRAEIPYSWSFDGPSPQKSAILVVDGTDVRIGGTLAHATKAVLRMQNAANMHAVAKVRVSTGGDYVESAQMTTLITTPIELSMDVDASLTAQPLEIGFECDRAARLLVTVAAVGASGIPELGIAAQPAGDVVWTAAVDPIWAASQTEGMLACTVTLPTGRYLRDGATYTVRATAVDTVTGARSEELTDEFAVAWEHQADVPSASIAGSASEQDGISTRKAVVTLAAPQGAAEGDVYDLYRLEHGRASLIASSLPLACTVDDRFAPFGEPADHAYRVALRTPDGDVEYADVGYELDGSVLRIDWAGRYVELPYNISMGEGYAKDAETVAHMDGSRAARYNPAVTRKATLSSDVIRLADAGTVDAVRDLAAYAGNAFVRTPDGGAFEAVVQVTDLGTTHGVCSVAIDAEQVDPTGAFDADDPVTTEEEEG